MKNQAVNMANGWVKLHRQLLNNPIFQNEKLLKVFIWCLLKATHDEYDQLVGREIVPLKQGQFVTGRHKGSAELGLKPSTFWDYLTILKSNNTIDIESDNKQSVISIVNWGFYQSGNYNSDNESDNKFGNSKHDSKSDNKSDNESDNAESMISIENEGLCKSSIVKSDSKSDSEPNNKHNSESDTNKKKEEKKNIYPENFEKFYQIYPNSKGKAQTLKNWNKVIKEHDPELIIESAMKYKKSLKEGTDKTFITTSYNFLGQKAVYMDYLPASTEEKPKHRERMPVREMTEEEIAELIESKNAKKHGREVRVHE